MKIHSVHFVLLLVAILVATGCKKEDISQPAVPAAPTKTPAPTDLPTRLLEGAYLWHKAAVTTGANGMDSSYTVTIAEYLNVWSDTQLYFRSSIDYNSNNRILYYEYVSSNDSEVVYVRDGVPLTYKKKRNLLIWGSGRSAHYGVPGATQKWGHVNKMRMDSVRHWQYKYEHYRLHFTRENTDTLANAVALFNIILDDTKYLSGADSTGSIYERYFYNDGPNELSLDARLEYNIKQNKIDYYSHGRSNYHMVDRIDYKTL